MPNERIINVYKIGELAGKARQRAIETLQHDTLEDFDPETLNEVFKHDLDEIGLPSNDIRWRLSSSQGDGVAFYGKFDLEEYVKLNKLWSKYRKIGRFLNEVGAEIRKNRNLHMYDHYNTMIVELDTGYLNLTKPQGKLFDELQEEIQEHTKEMSLKFEKIGYDEMDYQTSEKSVVEHAEINEYEFDENGRQI